jgi:hypothetical protein
MHRRRKGGGGGDIVLTTVVVVLGIFLVGMQCVYLVRFVLCANDAMLRKCVPTRKIEKDEVAGGLTFEKEIL